MPINSKNKGRKGEQELARVLNELLGIQARRGQQYCGLEGNADVVLQRTVGDDKVDIPGLHVECKRVECLSLYEALSQSKRDAQEGEIPVICHRRNNKPWVIIFELDQLKNVAKWVQSLGEIDDGESKSGTDSDSAE